MTGSFFANAAQVSATTIWWWICSAFPVMKSFGYPVLFDVTHALQRPGGMGDAAAGRRESVRELALAGMSQKIAGLFLEAHPEPEQALL